MRKKLVYILSFIFLTGCANYTTKKEEISKEEIKDIQDALLLSAESFDKRIKKIENNQSEIFNILNKNTNQISEAIKSLNEYISKEVDFSNEIKKTKVEIATLKEDIKSLNNKINELKGKIDEVIVNTEERNKKIEDDLNKKITNFERETTTIKKNYTEILSLPLTLQKSMNEFQNSFTKIINDLQSNIGNLKDTQIKLTNIIEDTSKQLNDLKIKIEGIENSIKFQNKTMVDELTRQESEIFSIKRDVFYLKRDIKEISERAFTRNDEIIENTNTLKKHIMT